MTEPTRFQLFSFWRTSATYRVRVALKFKGIYAQESNVNIDAGEQRTAEFLTLNPMGAIPALVDHAYSGLQSPMTQSLAILEFLEESYPAPALLPSDLHARARVRSLALMVAADSCGYPSDDHAEGQEGSRKRSSVQRRKLAYLANTLVNNGAARFRSPTESRAWNSTLLPWRYASLCGHLSREHCGHRSGAED
jgi:glutathione S-transferase